jgi:hypothetical protein
LGEEAMKTRLNILLCGGCYYLWERPLSDEMRCEHSDAPEDNLVPPTGRTPEWCPKMNPVETGEVVTPPPSPIGYYVPKYPVKRLDLQLIDVLAEPVVQQVPDLGTKLADLESRGLEIPNVRLVSVTYPPSMTVEEARTVQPHDWTTWLTGPPSDVRYEWCRACGTLKSMMHGDPTEYHVPGSQVSAMLEPPCKGAKP